MISTQLETTENVGVVIDPNLNLERHIKTITKSAFYRLNNISRIKGFMS